MAGNISDEQLAAAVEHLRQAINWVKLPPSDSISPAQQVDANRQALAVVLTALNEARAQAAEVAALAEEPQKRKGGVKQRSRQRTVERADLAAVPTNGDGKEGGE